VQCMRYDDGTLPDYHWYIQWACATEKHKVSSTKDRQMRKCIQSRRTILTSLVPCYAHLR